MSEGRFEVAVGGIIERADGKVLLLQRAAGTVSGGIWEIPIGRLKQFEAIEDGLRREIEEETGIAQIEIVMPITTFTFMRGGDTAEHEVKGITFWCRTHEKEAFISEEHQAHQWVALDRAIELTAKGIQHDLETLKKRRLQIGD